MTRLPVLVAAAIVLCTAPASAGAATPFYVSPDGTGADCTRATPCALEVGLQEAEATKAEAEVVALDTGAPFTNVQNTVSKQVWLHGEPGAFPVLEAGDGGIGLIVEGTASGMEIRNPYYGTTVLVRGFAYDLIIRAHQKFGDGTMMGAVLDRPESELRDSLVDVEGASSIGVLARPFFGFFDGAGVRDARRKAAAEPAEMAALIASTVLAGGEGARGVVAEALVLNGCEVERCEFAQAAECEGTPVDSALAMTNTIARGEGQDVATSSPDPTCAKATIRASHSNFSLGKGADAGGPIDLVAGNQTSGPALVTADLLDLGDELFHLRPASAARDAGEILPIPAWEDFEGDSRSIGGRPDIGWDELPAIKVAPVATTTAAGAVTQTTAMLNGTVAAGTAPVDARFELTGPGGAVRMIAAGALPASATAAGATAAVTGLAPATTYTFRLLAGGAHGESAGAPVAFTTPAPVIQAAEEPLLLSCNNRSIDLFDVSAKGSKVRVAGLAKRSFAGQTVTISAIPGGKVGTALVQPDGSFEALVKKPRKASLKRLRMVASVAGASSRALKLERRFVISSLRPESGRVRLKARVVGAPAGTKVIVERVLSCTETKAFGTFKAKRGAVSALLELPDTTETLAFYRLRTSVPRGRKTFTTFTLPIVVRRP